MARAWRKNNQKGRNSVALQNLKSSKFFEKTHKNGHVRTQEEWQTRKDAEIETLEKLV